jgi:homoserine/homoserine lactone efflux protein
MSFESWIIFAAFWGIFVITPGPNAVNCINNGMTLGFRRGLIGVAAILTQATLFLILSALGITALIAASPEAFFVAKLIGAGFLIFLGVRGWMNASEPAPELPKGVGSIYGNALAIAVINPKSVGGYLAAFSQFVQPDVPIWDQMWVIMPTALTLTTLSYTGFTAIGAGLGRAALGAVFNVWIRRSVAAGLILYGLLLGTTITPEKS